MKTSNYSAAIVLLSLCGLLSLAGCGKEQQAVVAGKPYPLDTCLVCGMKLADMGKPYVFVYQGLEIKVCDKSEKADFDKDPDKYIKKIADAQAKLKK